MNVENMPNGSAPPGRKRGAFKLIVGARDVEAEGLNAAARHVLLILATYADAKTHQSWPSVATLEANSGLARSTVQAALTRLENAGLIVRERRHRSTDGGYTSNKYLLRVTEGDARQPGMGSPTGGHGDAREPGNKNSQYEQPKEQPNTPHAKACGVGGNSEAFEQLLEVWPKRLNEQQQTRARRMFQSYLQSGVQADQIIEGARRYARSSGWSDESRIVDLRGWLFGERWTDEHIPRVGVGRLSPASKALAVDLGTSAASQAITVHTLTPGAGWFSENSS